ncbi:DMT family transporter [Sporosarcina aquimarina]|uniref:EamA family transporter n=1 Tax=Sporosarcina aquimarina TaxID=114975 RepID=UPI00204183D7|nr:DMT family transporter [Sporosarcina aquimarina]MCM3755888.1 DMT family transporter [Sporosarcina aquimarina]
MKFWIYPILVIVAASSYGILSSIVKLAIRDGYSASQAVTSQFFIGFLVALLLYVIIQHKRPRFGGGWTLILAGFFTALTGIVYGKTVEYMPASLAVVMLFQFTWIGMLFDCIASRRLPKRVEVISLVFLFSGTIFAAGILNVDLSGIPWQGWAFGLASATSFASFVMANQKAIEGMDTTTRLLFTSFFAAIVILLFQSPEIVWTGQLFTSSLLLYGLILGLFGIIIPIYLFSIAVPKVGTAMTSILSAMELPVAMTASVVLVGEHITFIQIIGILIILFGMTLPSLAQRRRKPLPHKTSEPL